MLQWVWVAIGLIFFYFAIIFYQYSKTPLRDFNIRQSQQTKTAEEKASGEMTIFKELQRDFGRYLESINSKNIARSRIAAIGFGLATMASFISAFLSSSL